MNDFIIRDHEIYELVSQSFVAVCGSAAHSDRSSTREDDIVAAVHIGLIKSMSEFHSLILKENDKQPSSLRLPLMIGHSYAFTVKNFAWDAFKHAVTTFSGFVCLAAGEYAIGTATSAVGITEFTSHLFRNFHQLNPIGRQIMLTVTSCYVKTKSYPTRSAIVQKIVEVDENIDPKTVHLEINSLMETGVLTSHDAEADSVKPGL